eukprot:TRINITY_DN329_c0_g1_i4.p1 TRINITY_DN329_c0_g1~~TRINITY_DN329_c0_g1_i4.p1  ORF type:complete len:152 (-),score=31.02 TRINITY_DN329_c0_g1_i4:142-597(-)
MALHSPQLVWHVLRQHNCFAVRRGDTRFSREKFNLRNEDTYKSSGLVRKSAVDLQLAPATTGPTDHVVVSIKTKKSLYRPSKNNASFTLKKGFRKGARALKKSVEQVRPDLVGDALSRYSRLRRSMLPKKTIVKKRRSKNTTAATAATPSK